MSITLEVKGKEIYLDPSQEECFSTLEDIKANFLNKKSNKSLISKIFPVFTSKDNIYPQGVYLYGKVGRGKSMLVNHFFNNFPNNKKLYLHFNSFMQKVHRQLYKMRKDQVLDSKDLLELVTKNIIKDNQLLCLDEFQVDDVADALILRRIFSYIFSKGIFVIFTSNAKPDNLYKDGLQRDLFLNFINNTLKNHCKILNLDSNTDYREKFLHKVKKHYFYPLNKSNNDKILSLFSHLSQGGKTYQENIKILGRDLLIKKAYENIAIFDFKDLCQDNLGVADYQEICKRYNIIFIINVPSLLKEDRNEAKRFTLLIDEVYENKNILLMSCEVKMDDIYKHGNGSKVFKRTVSRLKEIMSDEYPLK
jgi:cell division protein ZapE